MKEYKLINLNDYVQTGEGGTSLTYTHKTHNAMAKLFNSGSDDEQAEREFLRARAVFEMGIPTPEPYQLVTDGQRNLWIDLGQFSYGVPEWDLGWMWTICNRMDGKRSDFILHVTPKRSKPTGTSSFPPTWERMTRSWLANIQSDSCRFMPSSCPICITRKSRVVSPKKRLSRCHR